MEIQLDISVYNLGDYNSDEDNQRYISAVSNEIQKHYPDAFVCVNLVEHSTAGSCWVSDDPLGEIEEAVNMIANDVWEMAAY